MYAICIVLRETKEEDIQLRPLNHKYSGTPYYVANGDKVKTIVI